MLGRKQVIAVALASLSFIAACVTSRNLHDAALDAQAAAPQPIVTTKGAVPEAKDDTLLLQAARESTSTNRTQLLKLTDAVRRSLNAPLASGNQVTALIDGPATFKAIDSAIAGAHRHVHVETYIFADDDLGKQFANLLIQKRQQGVEVRLIYDAIGSITTPAKFFDDLATAGVEVAKFRPLNPAKTLLWRFHNRDHRKIIVVDGRVAFTGGMNISGAYSSSSSSKPGPEQGLKSGWRDTHVQIAGPAVHQFQALFLDTWSQLVGKIRGAKFKNQPAEYYPVMEPVGDDLVSAVGSNGVRQKDEAIYSAYLSAIRNSSKRVWITQAYFAPPAQLRDAMIEAVKRGVDIRVVVPGFTDSKLVYYASRSEYERLLRGGIRLYEQRDALLHAKTAVVDDALVFIGSANLDYRSFLHNNEVTAVIVGRDTTERMKSLYERDENQGKELKLAEWKLRPSGEKIKESLSSLAKFWL